MPAPKLNTRKIRAFKKATAGRALMMLTCYDYQTARMLDETDLDLVLVGDSLGNVILGMDTTVPVTVEMMKIFSAAVHRGARNKFVIADMPFGSYATYETGMKNGLELFQHAEVEALKVEGGFPSTIQVIEGLTQAGVAVMGHIGLTPQSVHQQGGYYTHGKDEDSAGQLMKQALDLQAAGCFSIVLECVEEKVAKKITEALAIPTIGIGSGKHVDGQVLVINDLLGLAANRPPKFCVPVANLYQEEKKLIQVFLDREQESSRT